MQSDFFIIFVKYLLTVKINKIYLILIVVFLRSFGYSQTHIDSAMFQLGNSIETSFYNSDTALFNELFDFEAFFENIIREDSSNYDLRMFNKGFKNALRNKFAGSLMKLINQDDYYNFINYSDDDEGNYYLRFRLFSESGLNYHEYFIPASENKPYKISDVFIYTTGEYFSETFNRVYDFSSRSVISNDKTHKDSVLMQTVIIISMFTNLREQGKIKEAAALLNQMPESDFKESKIFLIFKLSVTDINDTESYLQILEEFMHKFPDNPTIYLLGIDYFLLTEQYDRAHEMIDNIYDMTEDDFLDFYKGSICNKSGDFENAEKYLIKLLADYPYLFEGYEMIISVQIKQKKYNESVLLLDKIIEYFEINKDELTGMIKEFYPSLYKSRPFKNWKKSNQ